MTDDNKPTNDTAAALAVVCGKLGLSESLVRAKWQTEGMTDAALIATIQAETAIGYIYIDCDPAPLTDADRAWLAAHLFRVTARGRLIGDERVLLPLPDANGSIPGILSYDTAEFRRGDELSVADQYAAIAAYIRPAATWRGMRYEAK